MNRISALFLLLLAVFMLTAPCRGAVQYQLVDLDGPPPPYQYYKQYATDINSKGQIAGYWENETTVWAYVWENGAVTSIVSGYGRSINDAGEVAGDRAGQAYIWRNGEPANLGSLGGNSHALAINNSSQVAGWAQTSQGGAKHAFIWQDGVMTDIGTFWAQPSQAYAINNIGQVVGCTNPDFLTSVHHAFVWQNSVMTDLGFGVALGINDSGVIVGRSNLDTTGHFYPSIWQNNIRTDYQNLGDIFGQFVDINNHGQAVGYSMGESNERAILLQDGVAVDLNTLIASDSGWHLTSSHAINDNGYILGTGVINGQTRDVLLVPVPEPAGIIGIGIGLCGLLWRRKR